MRHMTAAMHTTGRVPDWTIGDRLRKARRAASIGSASMAETLGVTRQTVAAYESDRSPINRRTMIAWSFVCGVPLEWLSDGLCPPGDSNPEPADYGNGGQIVPMRRTQRMERPLPTFDLALTG
jgi:transcriptional regulator with XRE-family HTH domain